MREPVYYTSARRLHHYGRNTTAMSTLWRQHILCGSAGPNKPDDAYVARPYGQATTPPRSHAHQVRDTNAGAPDSQRSLRAGQAQSSEGCASCGFGAPVTVFTIATAGTPMSFVLYPLSDPGLGGWGRKTQGSPLGGYPSLGRGGADGGWSHHTSSHQ